MKVAIIGAGNMAREHIRAFNSLEGVCVSGIFNRTKENAEKLASEFSIPVVSSDIPSLKKESEADLVVITVPELVANKVYKAVESHDWDILMEKPAGYNLKDAQDIAKSASSGNNQVFVGFNRRFYSSSNQILADLNSRDEKRFITVQDQQSYSEARLHNHPEEVVKNFMFANSIHVIDLIRYFGRGEINKIEPIMPWKGEETEVVVVGLHFSSGDFALYEGIWKGPGPWACAVSTPSRRWTMQPLEQAEYQNVGERQRQSVPVDDCDINYKAGFVLQAQEIIKAVRGETHSAVTIQQSLETMQMIHDMFSMDQFSD